MRNIVNSLLIGSLGVPSLAAAGFQVSTYKKESRAGGSKNNGGDALDGQNKTCWMVDPETPNEGQWLELDVPVGKVDKIRVVGGWAVSEDTFKDYARAKTVKIEVFEVQMDGPKLLMEQVATLEDTRTQQFIDLPDPAVAGEIFGGKVRLTVQEVYPGKDYPNLAMSQVLVYMAEFDTTLVKVNAASSEAEGHGSTLLSDGNTRTFWSSSSDGEGATFEVEAPRYGVSSVGLVAGPKSHARPKNIEVKISDMTRKYTMSDSASEQWFEVPSLIGYTGSAWGPVTVTVVDTYPGASSQVAVAEVKLRATNLEDF